MYFDDFKITYHTGVEQTADYYPFGLTYNSYSRESSVQNRYLFNGGSELQTDLDLGWYSTPFRMYDPAIGRFTQLDPMADFFPGINPYSFAFDNPVLFGDPDGLGPILDLWRKIKDGVMNALGYEKHGNWNARSTNGSNVYYTKRSNSNGNNNSSSSSSTRPQSPVLVDLGSGPTRQEEKKSESDNKPDPDPSQDSRVKRIPEIPAKGKVDYTEVIEFEGGRDKIKDQYTAGNQLKELVDLLKQNPEIKAFIQGNVGDGELPGNKFLLNDKLVPAEKLMSARAIAIYKFLIEQGVDPKQLKHGTGKINNGEDGYNVTFELEKEQ